MTELNDRAAADIRAAAGTADMVELYADQVAMLAPMAQLVTDYLVELETAQARGRTHVTMAVDHQISILRGGRFWLGEHEALISAIHKAASDAGLADMGGTR